MHFTCEIIEIKTVLILILFIISSFGGKKRFLFKVLTVSTLLWFNLGKRFVAEV